jgi:WD40 repeat protein
VHIRNASTLSAFLRTARFWPRPAQTKRFVFGRQLRAGKSDDSAPTKTSRGRSLFLRTAALAVGAVYGTITLIESPSGKEIRHFMTSGEPGSNWVSSLAFTPDGKYLSSSHHSVPPRLWDANTGKEVRYFFTPNKYDQPHQLVFTPNGNFLLGCISHYGLAVLFSMSPVPKK